MAEQAGFEASMSPVWWLYQARQAGHRLVSVSELAQVVETISELTDLPVIVDADRGLAMAQCTTNCRQLSARARAPFRSKTKPCPSGAVMDGKTLVSPEEMNGKIRAALDARRNEETLIIARTDAVAVEGYDRAMERAEGCVDAGADVLFIEAVNDLDQVKSAVDRLEPVSRCSSTWSKGKTPSCRPSTNRLFHRYFQGRLYVFSAHAAGELFDTTNPWRNSALSR